ncbi:MAG: hypothetical protein U0271_27000 [Polyangiaceae bacterium]
MTALEDANDAWREGRIGEARRAYLSIVRSDPTAWGAAMQLAWLDAVFGRLSLPHARAMDRPELGERARALVAALIAMTEVPEPLDGTEDDWDLDAMRAHGADAPAAWWEERARRAAQAGLYGVALAAFEEAEARSPASYWDPPRWSQTLPGRVAAHLAAVTAPGA